MDRYANRKGLGQIMATLTNSMAVLAGYWYQQFLDNAASLNMVGVFYGDQAKIPYNPSLCVEAAVKNNELRAAAASRRIDQLINISIIIYHNAVTVDQVNAQQALVDAESVESFVHARPNCDGLVIHCYVTSIEAGYLERSGSLMKASRLNIEHKTLTTLPS